MTTTSIQLNLSILPSNGYIMTTLYSFLNPHLLQQRPEDTLLSNLLGEGLLLQSLYLLDTLRQVDLRQLKRGMNVQILMQILKENNYSHKVSMDHAQVLYVPQTLSQLTKTFLFLHFIALPYVKQFSIALQCVVVIKAVHYKFQVLITIPIQAFCGGLCQAVCDLRISLNERHHTCCTYRCPALSLVARDRLFWSALFNICRKALGHLMKFTQHSIPYRFGLAG